LKVYGDLTFVCMKEVCGDMMDFEVDFRNRSAS
jgi:hypothetical protein